MAYLKTIKTIKGYDVTILKLGLGEGKWHNEWYCGYVKLKGNLKKEEYCNETYREDNIVGVDTNHSWNTNENLELKFKDCIRQITEIIEEHISLN